MSQEKIARLQANLEKFNRTGELDVEGLPPDFEMHQASSIVDTAGVFRGRGSLRDSLRELQEAFEELSFEAEEYIEAPGGDVVVLIHVRGRGRGSGMEIDNRIAHVWSYRGDTPIRMVVYEEPAEALEALGLNG